MSTNNEEAIGLKPGQVYVASASGKEKQQPPNRILVKTKFGLEEREVGRTEDDVSDVESDTPFGVTVNSKIEAEFLGNVFRQSHQIIAGEPIGNRVLEEISTAESHKVKPAIDRDAIHDAGVETEKPKTLAEIFREHCTHASYHVFQLALPIRQVARTPDGHFVQNDDPTIFDTTAHEYQSNQRVTRKLTELFREHQIDERRVFEDIKVRNKHLIKLQSDNRDSFPEGDPHRYRVGSTVLVTFHEGEKSYLIAYGAFSTESEHFNNPPMSWTGGRANDNNSIVFEFDSDEPVQQFLTALDVNAKAYDGTEGTKQNYEAFMEVIGSVFPSQAVERISWHMFRQEEVQQVIDLRDSVLETKSAPPGIRTETHAQQTVTSIDTKEVVGERSEAVADSSKEKLIKEMSASVKYFAALGKAHPLVGTRPHVDFLDIYSVRPPKINGESQPFVQDIYSSPLKNIGFREAQVTHSIGLNEWVYPPAGEVTIRYLDIQYEDGENGLAFIVSMVHGKHPFDARWNNEPDYFIFDFPQQQGERFIEESLKVPHFVRAFLDDLTGQRQILGSYTDPQYVICATQPGINTIQPDPSRVSSRAKVIARDGYRGSFIISDGQEITTYPNKQKRGVPSENLLETVDIRLQDQQPFQLNRAKSDELYQSYRTVSETLKLSIEQSLSLRDITTIARANAGTSEFLRGVSSSLDKAHIAIAKLVRNERGGDQRGDVETNFKTIMQQIPDQFGIREKVRAGYRTILDANNILIRRESTTNELQAAIKSLADTVEYVYMAYSYEETAKWPKQIEKAISLMNQPDKLIQYFVDRDGSEKLDYNLASLPYFVDAKIFLFAYKDWNVLQRWNARKLLKKGEGNTSFLLEHIGKIDPSFKL